MTRKVTESDKQPRDAKYRKPRDANNIDLVPTVPTYNPDLDRWENAKGQPICGANRTGRSSSGPGVCCNLAGQGTSHVGFGKCYKHMGHFPPGEKAGLRQKLFAEMPLLGLPAPVGPHEAVLQEIQRTAGHVYWLNQFIQYWGIDPEASTTTEETQAKIKSMVQPTAAGIQPSVWIRMYQEERKHLVNVCRTAVSMGVAERTIAVIEENARMIASVIMAIFNDADLGLDSDQRKAFPAIARKHLTAIPTTTETP